MKILDSDVCIEILRGNEKVIERRRAVADDVATTWITASELAYGAGKSRTPEQNTTQMHTSLTLGALIREARERAGLTRAELARRARTSPSAVARYEAGQSSPKIDTAQRCLDACGFELRVELVQVSPQRQAAADVAEAVAWARRAVRSNRRRPSPPSFA